MSEAFLSPTASYRLMNGLENTFPDEIKLSKGAALLYEKVFVNLAVPGPLSSFYGAFTGGLTSKQESRIKEVFRPTEECLEPPVKMTIRQAINSGLIDRTFVETHYGRLDKRYGAATEFCDPDDAIMGEINPLASVEMTLLYGLPGFESVDRLETHSSFLKGQERPIDDYNVDIAIPDFELLSWEDILEIRQHPSWQELHQILESTTDPERLRDIVRKAWEDAGIQWSRSQERNVIFVLSALPVGPLPVPNPLAVYRDYKAWRRQRKFNSEYPWFHLVAQAREKTSQQ